MLNFFNLKVSSLHKTGIDVEAADIVRVRDADPPEFRLAVPNRKVRRMMDLTLRPYDLRMVAW